MTIPTASESTLRPTESRETTGRTAFVIKFGILGWGVPVALAVTAWDWYRGEPLGDLGVPLAIRLLIYGVAGIGFGAAMWRMSRRMEARAVGTPSENQQAS